jgi:hypothetical protein
MNKCRKITAEATDIDHLIRYGHQGRPRAACSGCTAGYAPEVRIRIKWTAYNTFCLGRGDRLFQVGKVALERGRVDERIPRVHAWALGELRGFLGIARLRRCPRRSRLSSTAGRCVALNRKLSPTDVDIDSTRRIDKSRREIDRVNVRVEKRGRS